MTCFLVLFRGAFMKCALIFVLCSVLSVAYAFRIMPSMRLQGRFTPTMGMKVEEVGQYDPFDFGVYERVEPETNV